MITTTHVPEEIVVNGDVVKNFLRNIDLGDPGITVSNNITTQRFLIHDKRERDQHAELVGKAVRECVRFLMSGAGSQRRFDGVIKLERTYECEPCRELEKNGEETMCHFNYELVFTPAQP